VRQARRQGRGAAESRQQGGAALDKPAARPDKRPDATRDGRGAGMATAQPARASLVAILGVFTALGMASFGGGLPGWMHREVVQKRGWMTDESFLAGVALGQVLPGANSVNLALYIGQQLRGVAGAAMAGLGILGPPFLFIIGLALLFARYGAVPGLAAVLGGVAASGLANSLTVGLRTARRLRGAGPWLVVAATFLAVGVLRLPMIPVVAVMIPLSIGLAWRRRHAA
jgi:chromate transporter